MLRTSDSFTFQGYKITVKTLERRDGRIQVDTTAHQEGARFFAESYTLPPTLSSAQTTRNAQTRAMLSMRKRIKGVGCAA